MKDKAIGTGEGKGHGGNTSNLPVIRPIPNDAFTEVQFAGSNPKTYKAGKLKIFHTHDTEHGHVLSISRPDRYPTWDEVAYIRYAILPNEVTMAMLLPPKEEYINIHNFCFILNEWREVE